MKQRKVLTLFDSRQNRERVRKVFYIVLLVILIVDGLIPKHGHFPWEEAYGFYAAYGFIGCIALIFIAKGLRFLVKREERYYD